jgi:hypothetical protein
MQSSGGKKIRMKISMFSARPIPAKATVKVEAGSADLRRPAETL